MIAFTLWLKSKTNNDKKAKIKQYFFLVYAVNNLGFQLCVVVLSGSVLLRDWYQKSLPNWFVVIILSISWLNFFVIQYLDRWLNSRERNDFTMDMHCSVL